MNVNTFQDKETARQQKNLTSSQKRTNANTKEGVLVNALIKDCPECKVNLNDTCDTLVISNNVQMPDKLYEKNNSKEKSLLPISAIALGVMGSIAAITAFIQHNAKNNLNIDALKRIPSTIRNVAINDEITQAIYRMVECPGKKTIFAGTGVFALTAMAFMGKTFFDGFRDVWVKRKEADIQKNLQENLIGIETQSFAGKIQITRSMLSQRALEFGRYLKDTAENPKPSTESFKALMFKGFGGFGSKTPKEAPSDKQNNLNYLLMGIATFAGIIGLGFLSIKNLTKSKGHLDKLILDMKTEVGNIAKKSTEATQEIDMTSLKNLFKSLESPTPEIEKSLENINWTPESKQKFISEVSTEIRKSTVEANPQCGGGSVPKTTFYSHVDDYRAFFYNYILDSENKQFRALFIGTTGLGALGYGGKLVGEAIKDVQVKKINADTEVELQQRLVSTELKNFKSKKDAAIQPLMEEFYKQAKSGKPKEELKTMADNILLEIKNGPPFVYS